MCPVFNNSAQSPASFRIYRFNFFGKKKKTNSRKKIFLSARTQRTPFYVKRFSSVLYCTVLPIITMQNNYIHKFTFYGQVCTENDKPKIFTP